MGTSNWLRNDNCQQGGADFAKFQTWRVENLKPGPWDKDGRRQIYEKAELKKKIIKFY